MEQEEDGLAKKQKEIGCLRRLFTSYFISFNQPKLNLTVMLVGWVA